MSEVKPFGIEYLEEVKPFEAGPFGLSVYGSSGGGGTKICTSWSTKDPNGKADGGKDACDND